MSLNRLSQFRGQVHALLQNKGVPIPFENERPWHELFFELSERTDWDAKPSFLEALQFDWDGPYPRCRELSEFLHALHWNACVDARNPHFDRITLPKGIEEHWLDRYKQSDQPERGFLERAAARAAELFADSGVLA